MHVETSNEEDRPETFGSSRVRTEDHAMNSDDIEQYGVWVKAGPVDVADDEEGAMQFKMEDLKPEPVDGALTQEEEELLGSLETAENGSSGETRDDLNVESLPELGEAEIDDLSIDDLSIDDLDLSQDDQDSSETTGVDLDQQEEEAPADLGDFELDLPDSNEKEESMDIPEGSAAILEKIERDLLSIKDELTALKNEIYSLRGGGISTEQPESEGEGEPGFFEEDEDETIALTGDELDNILNTADITEQTGQATASPEENDLMFEEGESQDLIDREDILVDEGEEALPAESEELTIEEPSEEVSLQPEEALSEFALEEETNVGAEDLLDLPQEEEIVLEDITETETPLGDETTAEPSEIELDVQEDTEEPTDIAFELDEDLELSQSEQEDLEATQDLLEDEELTELVEPEADETELAEMESEAAAEAEQGSEESFDENLDLGDEGLEPLEMEPLEEAGEAATDGLPEDLKGEIRTILKYMDQLLESLPEEKIEEFANSEYFDVYKRLFEELDLTT